MSLQWRRKVVVELFDLDSGTGFDETTRSTPLRVYTRHRMEVTYNASFGWGADYSQVAIYNLPSEEVGELRRYPNLGIRVYEGFIGETYYTEEMEQTMDWAAILNLMFVGKVNTIMGVKKIPNHLTTLYCIPLAGVFGQKEVTLRTQSGLNLREVISRLCVESGFQDSRSEALVDFTNCDEEVLNEVVVGLTFTGSFINCLTEITRAYHLWFSITNNKIRIYQKFIKTAQVQNPDEKMTILIQKGIYEYTPILEDVIGTPEATIGTLKVTVVANTKLVVGDVINISNLLETEENTQNTPFVSGIVSIAQGEKILYRTDALANAFSVATRYMISDMVHVLDTHGEAYATQIHAIISTEGIADWSKQRHF